MRQGDEGVIEINTAPLVGSKVVRIPFDMIDLFLMNHEEETDISDVVTIIEDNAMLLEFTSNHGLFVENCITCIHSESEDNGNIVVLPSGCKKAVPIRSNFPRYCDQFKQFD
jgi:hypothetical protein